MSTPFIHVKPVQAGSNLSHPSGGRPLLDEGGFWPDDGFTHRRIAEGGVTLIEDQEEQNPDAKAPSLPIAPAAVKTTPAAALAPAPVTK